MYTVRKFLMKRIRIKDRKVHYKTYYSGWTRIEEDNKIVLFTKKSAIAYVAFLNKEKIPERYKINHIYKLKEHPTYFQATLTKIPKPRKYYEKI